MTPHALQIREHYERSWGPARKLLRYDKGPVHQLPEDFRIAEFQRTPTTLAYATIGMSQPGDQRPIELHMFGRPGLGAHMELVEMLTVVAHFHRTAATLDLGHTVNFGQPLCAGGVLTHGLLSLPYLDGPQLEWLEDPMTRFLWLLPISEAERDFKRSRGVEALEAVLEAQSLDYLDLNRSSLI